jgi:UDP-N-acetylglucosamine--N-acetylmuramyl-(pentapeptide) pyrophosphoryl-undecaprenol N-acetylglucosamine transferase
MRKLKIAFCGGGTGGHYYPAVALLQEIGKRTDFDLLYFTGKG